MTTDHSPTAVLTSGGLDSAVLLAELAETGPVVPVIVRFGLVWEAAEERALRRYLAALNNPAIEALRVFELPIRPVYGPHWSTTGAGTPDFDSPDEAVFLPGRNLLLFAQPAIWCHLNGIRTIALGVLAGNPFPDASDDYFATFEQAVNRAVDGQLHFVRPYRHLDKTAVLQRGQSYPLELTLSCIRPLPGDIHCGQCNKCAERQHAFAAAGVEDRTQYGAGNEDGGWKTEDGEGAEDGGWRMEDGKKSPPSSLLHPPSSFIPHPSSRRPSAVWHPFTPMLESAREETPVIAAAEGFELIDAKGQRYLDGTSSLWCNVHGHRVPQIDAAVREQLDRVAHSTLLGLTHAPAVELANELVRRAPAGLSRVFYSDDGATAVEAALKIAFQYHRQRPDGPQKRDLFVGLSGAYHGDTLGAVSVGGVEQFHGVYGSLLFRTLRVPSPVAYRTPPGMTAAEYLQHCDRELEHVLRAHHNEIAAFVIEPLVQGAAGILVHPAGYLRRVRELTRELDIPLIADEVAVGFGRTGTLFACEREQVAPDILCLAKGLTGGYLPLAATLVTEQIYEAFLGEPWEGRTFFHGHTYTGNPLGCVAALASLSQFDANRVLDNVRANAARLQARLGEIAGWPHVGEIRQCGIMAGIELVADREAKERFPPQRRIGHRIALAARPKGAIIRPLGDTIVLMPAPAMPGELLDRLCDAAFAAIAEVASE